MLMMILTIFISDIQKRRNNSLISIFRASDPALLRIQVLHITVSVLLQSPGWHPVIAIRNKPSPCFSRHNHSFSFDLK